MHVSEEDHQRYLVGDAGSGFVAYPRRLARCTLVICHTEPNHLSRQPPRFLFATAVEDSLLHGFVGALSPAAAAQFRVAPPPCLPEGVTSLGIGYGAFILDHTPVRGFLDAEVQWTRNPSDAAA